MDSPRGDGDRSPADAQRRAPRPPAARRTLALPAPQDARRFHRHRLVRGGRPRRVDDGRDLGPAPLHERPDAVRGPAARRSPRSTRRASTSASSRSRRPGPAGASSSTSGRPRACSSSSLNGDEIGTGKDSHLASEFDLTDRLRPGSNTLTLRVVKWSDAHLRRGPGPVVARRDHPTGLPVRDPRRVPRRCAGRRRAGRRPVDRHARPDRDRRLPGPRAATRLDRRGGARGHGRDPAGRRDLDRPPEPRGLDPRRPAADVPSRSGLLPRRGRARVGRRPPPDGPAARRPRHLARRGPGRPALVRGATGPLPAARLAPRPGRLGRRGRHRPGRLPAGRDRRARPPGQRRPGLPARRQPPRLRPAHRARHLARLDARRPRR